MADVFISYSKVDRSIAEALANDLKEDGYDVWWDFELYAGDDFHHVIRRELAEAKAVIVIWSESAVTSQWVRGEAQEAFDQGKLIATHVPYFDTRKLPINFRALHTENVGSRANIVRAVERCGVRALRASPCAKPLPDDDVVTDHNYAQTLTKPAQQTAGQVDTPSLSESIDIALREAQKFLQDSGDWEVPPVLLLSQNDLGNRAIAEAETILKARGSPFQLTEGGLTPAMDKIASEVRLFYRLWLTECQRHTDALGIARANIEVNAEERRRAALSHLQSEKEHKLSELEQKLAGSPEFQANRLEHAAASARLHELQAYNKGQIARPRNFALYWSLSGLTGAAAGIANYPAFNSMFELPISLFTTGFVACIIAISAHVCGLHFKQRHLLYVLDRYASQRRRRELWIVASALFTCLAFVGWASISHRLKVGSFNDSLSIAALAPTMFVNIVIWAVGIALSYLFHERTPGLREIQERVQALEWDMARLKERLRQDKAVVEREYLLLLDAHQRKLQTEDPRLLEIDESIKKLQARKALKARELAAAFQALMRKFSGLLCARLLREPVTPAPSFNSGKGSITLNQFVRAPFELAF